MKHSIGFGFEDLIKNKLHWMMVLILLTTIMITFINSTNSLLFSNQYHAFNYTWQNPSAIVVSKEIEFNRNNRELVLALLQNEAFSFVQSFGLTEEFNTDTFYVVGNLSMFFPSLKETGVILTNEENSDNQIVEFNDKKYQVKLSTDVERIASFINFDKVNLQNKPIYLILVTDSFEIQDMVRSMSPYSYYQVLSNLVLYSMNSEANNRFVNMFNDNRDFIELRLNDYPVDSTESSFIKSYIYPIIGSGLLFLFVSLFIFINGLIIRNIRKYAIYLSYGAMIKHLIVALMTPFTVIIATSFLIVMTFVDFVNFSPLKPSFVLILYMSLIVIYLLLCTYAIRSSTVRQYYK